MANILFFTRNRSTSVEEPVGNSVRAHCRLQDTLTDAFVEIKVQLPDLELTAAAGQVFRSPKGISPKGLESLQKLVGVRIGPGMTKIMKSLAGDAKEMEELLFMVEECCQAVILSFTKEELAGAPRDEREASEFYAKLVKENTRLYNSCIAFAPDSPLVKGIKPPVTSNE